LLKTEASCRLGASDINSPTCQAALSQVTRDATGMIESIFTPRVNVSREDLRALIANVQYGLDAGRYGSLAVEASWSDLLKHRFQLYPSDPVIDELRDPIWSTDFKSKINGSLTWKVGAWSSTAYIVRYGRSPNYLATSSGYGTPGAAALPPWVLCNLTASFQWTQALGLSFTVDNAFNRMPPADHTSPGSTSQPYNSDNYNVYGRSYLLALRFQPQF
jgi:iron complex outermembrane receptor protein